jgi:DNA-binding FrmR family transcriptional regulator
MDGETHEHQHHATRAVVNRLSRAVGHLEAVKQMVQEDRDCGEVLIQLAAVQSALRKVGKMILTDHIEHCVLGASAEGGGRAMEDLARALDQFLK